MRSLSAPEGVPFEVASLATIDLDADGRSEIVVQTHTARDSKDPYFGRSRDVEALLIFTQVGNAIQLEASVSTIVTPNTYGGARPIVELLALGRRNNAWDLLVRSKVRYRGKPSLTPNIEINGQQMKQPDPGDTYVTDHSLTVYRFADGKLVASKQLAVTSSSFCSGADCGD